MTEVTFGEWLKRRRKSQGWTQAELAQQINCSTSMLKKIESEQRRPSEQIVEQLAKAFGIQNDEQAAFLSFTRGNWKTQPPEITDSPWLAPHPPKQDTSTKHNLPSQLTSFIGREEEISNITVKLETERLITVTGPGGTGKTRISIQIANEALDQYPDGVWMVKLATVLDPLLVPRITANSIGLPEESQRPATDMLCDYLRDKKMLILFDNCEHLIEACATLVDILLSACPKLYILTTSRESLGITGETIYQLRPLKFPQNRNLPPIEVLGQMEAVRLFVERAIAAKQGFNLTTENASSIAQICKHLDGIPLAIELAASKIRTLSPQQIVQRLDERFIILIDGNRTALPRHQTLQAAIEWSYELLSAMEQALFRRLSVFVNGWTLEAAESVCSPLDGEAQKSKNILNLLAQLVNKSLVMAKEKDGEIRYHMLETIWQYADTKLEEADESEYINNRHLDYFLQLAETAEPELYTHNQLEWLTKLDDDYENLRTALKKGLSKESPELSLRISAALGRYWDLRGYWKEGLDWLEKSLTKLVNNLAKEETSFQIRALYQDALLAERLDALERMKKSAEMSFNLAKGNPNTREFAIAQCCMGLTYHRQHKYAEAQSLFAHSLTIFRDIQDAYWEAFTYSFISNTLAQQGEIDNSTYFERIFQTIEMSRKIGDSYLTAFNLWEYSHWYFAREQLDEAANCLKEADTLFKKIGAKFNPTTILLAQIAHLQEDYKTARALLLKVEKHFKLLGEKLVRLDVNVQLGHLEIDDGNLDQAQIYLNEAHKIARELDNKTEVAFILAVLFRLSCLQENLKRSKQYLKESTSIAKNIGKDQQFYFLELIISSPLVQQSKNYPKLLGTLDQYSKENGNITRNPLFKRYHKKAEAHARETIGNTVFDNLFTKGKKLLLEDAFDLVLNLVETIDD